MSKMIARDLVAISTLAQHAHGTRVNRMAPFLIGNTAGLHIYLIAQPALIEEVAQDNLSHRGPADIAGANGHYGIGLSVSHHGLILNRGHHWPVRIITR